MDVVLRDVTVVDTHDGTRLPNRDVHIEGDTIARVTPTGGESAATVVEGHGRYVVPGYLDMHAHPLGWGDQSGTLALMLASGVTGFRQMAGTPELLAQKRSGTLPQDTAAALAVPGMPLIALFNAGDPDTAVATIREQHAQGADFIKIVETTPAVFEAALAEASRLGIPVAGHLPTGIDVREASRLGMRCVEHVGPGLGVLASCSDDEAAVRVVPEQPPVRAMPQLDEQMMANLRKMVINPLLRYDDGEVARLRRAIDTFNEDKARELAELLAANDTWQCPTLIRERTMHHAHEPAYRDDPDLRYVATETLDDWRQAAEGFARRSPEAHAVYRDTYELLLRVVKVFDDAGVPMLAGSDSCGAGWEVPGIALHQEFDELARAGLSPLRVLQMTTVDGARFLGLTDRLGSVEAGKAADLVLLDADPLDSVRNLRTITGVVRAGRHHDKADLDRIRDDVAGARAVG